MVGTGAIIGIVSVVLVLLLVIKRMTSDGAKSNKETRTIQDTAVAKEYFERIYATIVYPDGSEESIEYDDQIHTNTTGMTAFVTYDEDCFEVDRNRKPKNQPKPTKSISEENKRFINLNNTRELNVNRTEKLVAVTDVTIENEQIKSDNGSWYTDQYTHSYVDEEHDFDIWLADDWDNR